MRVGIGYDIHKLVGGRNLIIGGEKINSDKGLEGHSDGDVLIHAIIESLIGGAALNDIGTYFPSSDPQYKNISSLILLKKISELLKENNFLINNIDCTILTTKEPFLHVKKMKKNISNILGIDEERINIKPKTTNGLGIVAEKKAIEVYAVASLLEKGELDD